MLGFRPEMVSCVGLDPTTPTLEVFTAKEPVEMLNPVPAELPWGLISTVMEVVKTWKAVNDGETIKVLVEISAP